VKTLEWETFAQISGIGHNVSNVVLLLIAVFFGLRLRFITSAKGEFYEQEISVSPSRITRWRDAFDDVLIRYFFNANSVVGRFFVDPHHK
jgi:hypothetical protein